MGVVDVLVQTVEVKNEEKVENAYERDAEKRSR